MLNLESYLNLQDRLRQQTRQAGLVLDHRTHEIDGEEGFRFTEIDFEIFRHDFGSLLNGALGGLEALAALPPEILANFPIYSYIETFLENVDQVRGPLRGLELYGDAASQQAAVDLNQALDVMSRRLQSFEVPANEEERSDAFQAWMNGESGRAAALAEAASQIAAAVQAVTVANANRSFYMVRYGSVSWILEGAL